MAGLDNIYTEALVSHWALPAQLVDEEVHDVLGMAVQLFAELCEVQNRGFFGANPSGLWWFQDDLGLLGWIREREYRVLGCFCWAVRQLASKVAYIVPHDRLPWPALSPQGSLPWLNNPSFTLLSTLGGFLALLLKFQHLYLLKLLFHCLFNIQEIIVDRVVW